MEMKMLEKMIGISQRRGPDIEIGGSEDPYLRRWYIIPRNRWFNVYLHEFCRSDDDRALHDHPWWNMSLLLRGQYTEHTIAKGGVNLRTVRRAGQFKFRGAKSAHRIEITHGHCWTLFITGPAAGMGFPLPAGLEALEDFHQRRPW